MCCFDQWVFNWNFVFEKRDHLTLEVGGATLMDVASAFKLLTLYKTGLEALFLKYAFLMAVFSVSGSSMFALF